MENKRKLKICSVTGHRHIPEGKMDGVYKRLSEEILAATSDGYNYFISGFADGVDLLFAEIIGDIKQGDSNIFLEAALPYTNRINSRNPKVKELLKQCDVIHTVSDKYNPGCFIKRNQYMADQSQRLIAVYDGRSTGGTFNTIVFARSREIELKVIDL